MLAAVPASDDPAFLAHRAGCPSCAAAHADAQAFERTLERALAVPVPAGLAERVLLEQTTTRRQDRATPARARWRLAAGFVLAFGAGAAWYAAMRPQAALADLAVEHLAHEPYALAARADVPSAEIAAAFRRAGAPLVAAPARVDYLQNCTLDGREAVHLVVQRPEGPVTLLFVVADTSGARTRFERGGLKGRAVPLPHGTLVLLASEDRSFDTLERDWRRAIAGAADLAYAAR